MPDRIPKKHWLNYFYQPTVIMKKIVLGVFAMLCFETMAQNMYLKTSSNAESISLTPEGAAFLAKMPLHCINNEYPNKPNHTLEKPEEVVLSPKQLHPSFYGCLDWHSSVHGHWMLVRLLKLYPNMPDTEQIKKVLDESFKSENLQAEADYFTNYKLAKGFERTYGWAWLLKLDEELQTWDNPLAKRWHAQLQPLTKVIVQRWKDYLPKQTYPNRTGVHPNTAFGMVFALDWARTTGNKEFEALLVQRSKDYYLKNTNTPANLEPDGTDFLSPSLEIADLMRRILPKATFVQWFNQFITPEGLKNLMQPPFVSDRNDYSIVHLDGLSLSRAWCMKGIAKEFPNTDPRKKMLQKQAVSLLNKTLPQIASGNYGGEHWLASFAVYALSVD